MWNCNLGFINGGGPGWFMGGGMFGFIWTVLLLMAAVYIAIKFFQAITSRQSGKADRDDSLNIIKAKYAKGEISEDEFERMKAVLIRQ